jgi:uncharacterized membrane protein YhaH (DUF805 family)
MNITESISTCYNKYFTFKGRASRSEYWWFTLYATIGSIIINASLATIYGEPLMTIDPNTGLPAYTVTYWIGLDCITNPIICFRYSCNFSSG